MTPKTVSQSWQRLQTLAEFRYVLRRFLQFSELRATDAGLHPQQHQLLLHIAGAPDGTKTTISYIAGRLGLRHHSAVELSKRCEETGLLRRRPDIPDRRCVTLQITAKGRQVLEGLTEDHERELNELMPRLIGSLTSIRNSNRRAVSAARDNKDKA